MAATDSRRAGFIAPLDSAPGNPEDIVREWLIGISGIDKALVRKRWYARPMARPPLGTDWAAVGITGIVNEGLPESSRKDAGIELPEGGTTTVKWAQRLDFTASFYGPGSFAASDLFRLASQLSQHEAWLRARGLVLITVGEVRRVPELYGEVWVDRHDVDFVIGRKLERTFGVRSIRAADIGIYTERGKI